VHPDWQWFWNNDIKLCTPFWDGVIGTAMVPYDLITRDQYTLFNNDSDATWNTSSAFKSLMLDLPDLGGGAGQRISTPSAIAHGIGTGDFTICWAGRFHRYTVSGT